MRSGEAMQTALFQGEYPVSQEKIDFFQENGYVQFDDVLTDEEVEALRADLAKATAEKKGFVRDLAGNGEVDKKEKDKILQMLNLWQNYDNIRTYVMSRRIAQIARQISKSTSIHLFHDQALVKEPGPSAPSPWHQDQPYWPSKEAGMLSCWMALDDVTIDRGCMQFVPGSHKWGEFAPIDFGGAPDHLKTMMPPELLDKWKVVPVELKKGSCTFHHGLTFHYTNANTTDKVRRAFVTIFIPDGVNFAADEKMEHPFSDTITSKKGEPLRGSIFEQIV